jgi:trimeric autotransporter adhesin
MSPRARRRAVRILVCTLPFLAALPAAAQWRRQEPRPLDALVRTDPRLLPNDAVEPLTSGAAGVEAKSAGAWDLFQIAETGEWQAYYNRSNGRVEMVEGAGIPWLPGTGNQLVREDLSGLWALSLPETETEEIRLATLERIARAFLPRVQTLLGVDPANLVLNLGRSGQPAAGIWFVDFDVVEGDLPIDGARVVFRVNHGNLIQFGSEGLPAAGARRPRPVLSREKALAMLMEAAGVLDDELLDAGSLHLLTSEEEGKGRELLAAWQFLFRRPGTSGTWRARVDATTGALLELADVNEYGKVKGGVYLMAPTVAAEIERPLPDGLLTGASAICANSSGSFPGLAGTAALAGCYIRVTDTCGSRSRSADPTGLIDFGVSAGTDCTTPGEGGAGNTHASRTQFYHLTRIREVGRGWLPTNTWLSSVLNANVNLNQTCNAYWDGTSLNFFKSGGGCPNSGELIGLGLHEYGHGLDANDGNGPSPDAATGESYGDFTYALQIHDSCVGTGYFPTNCSGYGDPCTACTGLRDIDWANHLSGIPHTVANFTQVRCPAGTVGDVGPCGKEGHCESYIPSEALWDFATRDLLPTAGAPGAWLIADRLWYLSRSTATQSFSCTPGGTYTSNGCNIGSLWKTFRAIDDDDGSLANGTPHSCSLYAAFNRHGIACPTDPGTNTCFNGCPATPGTPALTATTGTPDQVALAWTNLGAGVTYDVFASIAGCKSAFTKIADNTPATSLTDTGAGNGVARAYQVIAHATNNAACAGPATACTEVVPCTTTTLLHEAFGAGATGWTLGTDWHDQTCSLSGVLHFGGTTCTTNYGNNRFALGQSPAIAIPAGTLGAKLTLVHRYQFETGADGGALQLSLDGGTPIFLPATMLSGTLYTGTIGSSCAPAGTAGAAVFTGTQSSFVTTTVNLDAACNLASGGVLTSCGGHTIKLDFAGISDCSVTAPGWFLDDVAVSACVP